MPSMKTIINSNGINHFPGEDVLVIDLPVILNGEPLNTVVKPNIGVVEINGVPQEYADAIDMTKIVGNPPQEESKTFEELKTDLIPKEMLMQFIQPMIKPKVQTISLSTQKVFSDVDVIICKNKGSMKLNLPNPNERIKEHKRTLVIKRHPTSAKHVLILCDKFSIEGSKDLTINSFEAVQLFANEDEWLVMSSLPTKEESNQTVLND